MPTLDLTEEEIQVFLAETDEQLQTLEDGLLRLEQAQHDPTLLQGLFRAAHTLKGSSGMIGHTQIVDLTHALENVFDDLRKDRLTVSTPLMDACLQSVDKLKHFRNEIAGTPTPAPFVPPLPVEAPLAPEPDLPVPPPVQPFTDIHPPVEKTIRTSVERLDNLLNLVGELITERNRLIQLHDLLDLRYRGDKQFAPLAETITHLDRIVDQLQEEVMGLRMLPVSTVFNKFPRLVRDLARRAGKQVELVIVGADTELDRSVLEQIGDPLIHLLRNAVDHGIETPADRRAMGKREQGTLLLTARHENGQIKITLKDDGNGIDLLKVKNRAVQQGLLAEKDAASLSDTEAMELIFAQGLSTAQSVSEISGRGVGMDIVRTNLEKLNGTILMDTWPGEGTQFDLILPLTLAIIPTLLVETETERFAIPLMSVSEAFRLQPENLQSIQGRPALLFRGNVLPLVCLREMLGAIEVTPEIATRYVVSVRFGKAQIGIVVDRLIGEEEVMVKSLGRLAGKVPGVTGAAILGDGNVVLILDIPGLIKSNLHHEEKIEGNTHA